MTDIKLILKTVKTLGVSDSKKVERAVRKHLEDLEDVAAYDKAKALTEKTEPLESILIRYCDS